MILTIHLDRVLHEAVGAPYTNLVTRPTGAAVRWGIERALQEANCLTALLDFSSVGLLDYSCADEVVAKLLLRTTPEVERYVVLHGASEDHCEIIGHILTNQQLAIVSLPPSGGDPEVLGELFPDAQEAFRFVYRAGRADAAELGAALGWAISRAAAALRSLASRRLVRPSGDAYFAVAAQ